MGLFSKGGRGGAPTKKDALSKRGTSELARKSFSMTVGALEAALLKEFPAEDAEGWDRTGLLVGERSLPVTRVAVALDPTVAAIAEAAAAGANVLLTHHPAYLAAPDAFAPEASTAVCAGAGVWAAIRHQVALMDFHTALDVSPAAARVLPGMLGLKFTGKLAEPLSSSRRKGYGQVCEVPANGDARRCSAAPRGCGAIRRRRCAERSPALVRRAIPARRPWRPAPTSSSAAR